MTYSNRIINFAKLFLGNSVGQVIALALYPYIARYYFPEDFSTFGFMTSLTMVLSVFATGQFHTALLNPEDEEEANSLIGLATVSVTIFSLLTIAFFSIYNRSLLIISVYLFVYSLFEIQKMYFIRHKYYNQSAVSQVSFRLIGNGGKLLPIVVPLKSFGLILSEILALCLVVGYGIKRSVFKLRWNKETFIKYKSFPLFHSLTMAMNLLILDFPILFWIGKFNKEDLGYFVMGQKLIILPALVVSNAVQNSSVHSLLSSKAPFRDYLKQALILVCIGLGCSVLFNLFGGAVLVKMLGTKWSQGEQVFSLLALLIITKLIFATTQAIFVLRGITRRTLSLRAVQVGILILCIGPSNNFYESLKKYIIIDMAFDVILIIWAGFIIRSPFVFRQQPK